MRKRNNYLDYVPKRNEKISCRRGPCGRIELVVPHHDFFGWLAWRFFRRPRVSYIELDEFGSFLWEQINGSRSVYEICLLIREKFGREAEPLFERAVSFFQILRRNAFIHYGRGSHN